jgi:hypothetical protein
MAASITTLTTNKMIDAMNGKTTYTAASVWVALSSTTPVVAGTGFTEPTIGTGGYARVATTGATWTAASGGSTSNASAITFPVSTAAWTSGASNLTYYGLYDASTAGNLVAFGLISNPSAVNAAGITVAFAIGGAVTTLS